MIIYLKQTVSENDFSKVIRKYKNSFIVYDTNRYILVTPSNIKEHDIVYDEFYDAHIYFENDIQISSRKHHSQTRIVCVGNLKIGEPNATTIIAGPCAVESEKQIRLTANLLSQLGINFLRAGCYKPRTSPYTFQGMGLEGLQLLRKVGDEYGLKIVTEVRDATHVKEVADLTDIIQIGAKAMYDHGILKYCSTIKKPILLKRGFGSTLQEFVQAAEFIMSGGNMNVILCERGIRTFEPKTRFSLDLCGAAWLRHNINLPIILDPSHAMGAAYGVGWLATACSAFGTDGLLIEVHPNPSEALSDVAQQLNFDAFSSLLPTLKAACNVSGRIVR